MKLFWVALFTGALLSATPVTQTVQLVNPGDPHNVILGNVYVSPYGMQINNQVYAAMCIDFNDDSYIGQPWKAYITNLGSGDLSDTYRHADPNASTEYAEEAYLYSQITKNGISDQTRTDIQEAVWKITDAGYLPSVDSTAVTNWIGLAQANYGSINLNDYEIVSDVNQGTGRNQEFMMSTPEPGSLSLLGAGVLFLAFGIARKRSVKVSAS